MKVNASMDTLKVSQSVVDFSPSCFSWKDLLSVVVFVFGAGVGLRAFRTTLSEVVPLSVAVFDLPAVSFCFLPSPPLVGSLVTFLLLALGLTCFLPSVAGRFCPFFSGGAQPTLNVRWN